ncbi:MAG: hypothetical protein IH589_12545 [Anaerolineales bacterium]|nr:hypothetical protein [Anaerolineales bacterium]
MDTTRQILRWSIPGWVFSFMLFLFWLIMARTIDAIHLNDLISAIATHDYGLQGAAVLAATGIPLGYFIYQIYFYLYAGVLPFDIVSSDRGLDVLFKLPSIVRKRIMKELNVIIPEQEMSELAQIKSINLGIYRLKKQHRNFRSRQVFKKSLREHWEIIRYCLTQISIKTKSEFVNKEVTTLTDIYHSLGASRVALFLAYFLWITFIAIRITSDANSVWAQELPNTILGAAYTTLFFVLLYIVLTTNRNNALISVQKFLEHSFYSFFRSKLSGGNK